MKKWTPETSNIISSLKTGPKTRCIAPESKRDRRILKLLRRFSGHKLARTASFINRTLGRGDVSFSFNETTGLYVCHNGLSHHFAHPKRIWTLFGGRLSRGRRLGYEYLLDQIEFKDGDQIIDVGANTGDLMLVFEALGRRVHLTSFEPSPGEFAALQTNLASCPSVETYKAHQLALWSAPSEGLTFYIKSGHADHSVVPIDGVTETIKVPAMRLSDVINDGETRFRLLKLEAEGVEPEVLEGARELLPRIDYIAADVGFERGVDAQSTLPQIANLLLTNGFEIVGFEGSRFVLLFRNTCLEENK